jgi:acetyl esterase/lipase
MMKFLPLLLCVVVPIAFVRASDPTTAPVQMKTNDGPGGTVIIRDMEIAKVGDGEPLLIDIARPKVAKGLMPAILCVHGGGWSGGTKEGALKIDWAVRGYFVVSVGYRLAGKHLWPAQIEDCKTALRWIRANAKKYSVNPDKIGAWGHSAGGHLVACLGTMGKIAGLDDGPFPGFSSEVQAVADYAGPTDLAILFHQRSPANLFGPNAKDHPEMMEKASPIHFVSSSCPPFLIVQGDQDKLVPIEQAAILADALKKAGASVDYVVVKNAGHSLGNAKSDPPCEPTAAEVREMTEAFFDKYLKE